ncbi:hypothetical protein [Novosphingobium sp. MBES04]|uniref:hypothetical protein n=1 Tax=Novosphingobium sp. MBES04 TaxID=1206458 RepID=UPI00057EE3FE|nr:hypothetical protein [Novosphingobium sp. MBES04]
MKDEVRVSLFDAATRAPLPSFAEGKDPDVDWRHRAGKDRLLVSLSQSVPFYDTYNASDVLHGDPDRRFLLMSRLATAYHAPWSCVSRTYLRPTRSPG